mgnify:CR=1 FL=1
MTDVLHRVSETCFKKCIAKYGEGELQVGEMTCIDRCVGKFLEAQAKVGLVIGEHEKLAQAQMQAAQAPGAFGRR